MSHRTVALLALPLVVLAWYAGYVRGREAGGGAGAMLPVSGKPGTPVATFDGVSLTDADLKAQLEEQAPFVRARYASAEGKREFLDNLVRFELLAREAQKKGYAKDPDIVRQHKRNMVALYVQREFEEPQQKQPIPEEELRKYYEDHKSDYVRPERVRAAHVLFAAPSDDAAKRKDRRAAAEAALAELREKDARDYSAFGALARKASEDVASRPLGGDLQFLSREDLAKRAGEEVAQAAFGAAEMGRVLDTIVETPKGFHIVKVLGKENPLDLAFEGVKDSIRSRLVYERRSAAYKTFLEGLNQKAGLKIDAAALEAVKVEAGAPAGSPGAAVPPPPAPHAHPAGAAGHAHP